MVLVNVTAEMDRAEAERLQAEFDALPKCCRCGVAHQSDGPVLTCVICGLEVTARQADYLRWVASGDWPTSHLPPSGGVPAGERMADRRALLKAGLLCFASAPGEKHVPHQRLTEEGKLLADALPPWTAEPAGEPKFTGDLTDAQTELLRQVSAGGMSLLNTRASVAQSLLFRGYVELDRYTDRLTLTLAGRSYLAALLRATEPTTALPRPAERKWPLTVEVSDGRHPVYYLTDQGDGGDPRMVLATLNGAYNPRAAEDALLFAASGRLKQLLGDLVDAITDKNTVTRGALVCEAVRLLEQLG